MTDPHHVLSFLFKGEHGEEEEEEGEGEEKEEIESEEVLERRDLETIVPTAAQQVVQPPPAATAIAIATATAAQLPPGAQVGPLSGPGPSFGSLVTPKGLAAPVTPKAASPGPTIAAAPQIAGQLVPAAIGGTENELVKELHSTIIALQDLVLETSRAKLPAPEVESKLQGIMTGPATRHLDILYSSRFSQAPAR